MSDDKTKSGGQDRTRINTHEDYELRSWSEKFGVTGDQLKAAVKAVGPSAKAVEDHLKSGGRAAKPVVRSADDSSFAPESGDKPDAAERSVDATEARGSAGPSKPRAGADLQRTEKDNVSSAPESGEKPEAS